MKGAAGWGQRSLTGVHCGRPSRQKRFSLRQKTRWGGVGLGAPQLGLDSAGDVSLLKNNVTRQLPGLRDHKCLDLGGRHSEQSTELWFLGRVPRPITVRSIPQTSLTTPSPVGVPLPSILPQAVCHPYLYKHCH